jgi:hypothetical protein
MARRRPPLTCPTDRFTSRTIPRCGTVKLSVVPSMQATRSEINGTAPPQCSQITSTTGKSLSSASPPALRFRFFDGGFESASTFASDSRAECHTRWTQQHGGILRPCRVCRVPPRSSSPALGWRALRLPSVRRDHRPNTQGGVHFACRLFVETTAQHTDGRSSKNIVRGSPAVPSPIRMRWSIFWTFQLTVCLLKHTCAWGFNLYGAGVLATSHPTRTAPYFVLLLPRAACPPARSSASQQCRVVRREDRVRLLRDLLRDPLLLIEGQQLPLPPHCVRRATGCSSLRPSLSLPGKPERILKPARPICKLMGP